MQAVPRAGTRPEKIVRRLLHSLGLRFRLHRADLPGTPDIVLPRFRTAIFVHGCFWHRHSDCARATSPKTRVIFWKKKFAANIERDMRKQYELQQQGWTVLIIWECETRTPIALERKLALAFGRAG